MKGAPDLPGTRRALGALGGLLVLNLGPAPLAPGLALGAALAWALGTLDRRGALRLGLLAAYAALTGGALALFGDPARGLATALRLTAGGAAGLAFAATVREADLRETLRHHGLPAFLLDLLDEALLHGRLLGHTLRRRLDASRLRDGGLPGTALALAGGVERAFTRAEVLACARALREASATEPPRPGPALQLQGLALRHPGGGGLHPLDLRVEAGEWLAILGPSGSGKSTLLRVAAGLAAPTAGTLHRHGREGMGRLDGHTALVFQDPEDQLLAATPLEDAAWGLQRRGLAPAAARAQAGPLLDALGLGARHHHLLHQLSHGERKRAAFASALALQPALLLLDEPTAGLDPRAARTLVARLEATVPEATVLWATHDLHHLPARVKRVLVLRDGEGVFLGPREEALTSEVLTRAGLV